MTEPTCAITAKEVEQYIRVYNVRESVLAHLAIFAGMRPGEILGLQRQPVSEDSDILISMGIRA